MTLRNGVIAVGLAFVLTGPAWGQAAETAPAPPAENIIPQTAALESAAQVVRIPAGTVVQIELTEALSSETSQQEQLFGLRLAAPIIVDGREVAAAGAVGGGEVIDAAPSAFGGRPGRLIVSGRYLEIGGQRVRIRGMQITAAGDHRVNEALAVSMIPYAGLASIFIQGGEVEIRVGARGVARLAADVDVPADPAGASHAVVQVSDTPQQALGGENQQ